MVGTRKISRVRTGCLTCRGRRIKCDERRPHCDRCRTANFRCEGYEDPRSVQNTSLPPRRSSQASSGLDRPPASSSASPRSNELSQRLVEELPWRHTQWRSDQLPIYHHFVTSTVKRLFIAEHETFWRDRVAQISFERDGVYQALLAVGAAHRASLLSCSNINTEVVRTLKLQGLRAYGSAIKFLAASLQGQESVRADPEMVLIILLLCTYFECFMESTKSALRHLYAAIRVLRGFEQLSPTKDVNIGPIYDAVMRLDFLAMKLIPYASSAFSRCPSLAFTEYASWSKDADFFSLAPPQSDRRLAVSSQTITIERHRLIQIVSTHNKLSRVVWGPWYPISERPSRDKLMEFYTALLLWKANSTATFNSCVLDLDSQRASTIGDITTLPIPPDPLTFMSSEAAVNVIMYNSFLGCALAMISTSAPDRLATEIESYNTVYQNMRICAGLLDKHGKQGLDDHAYKPCDSLDMGISVFLYHGARRCFSVEWQQWIVAALHTIGREGLSNAHALAKTLEIMILLEKKVSWDASADNNIDSMKLPLGPLCDRTVPVTIPKEDGLYEAYFLRYGTAEQDGDESLIRLIGLASWRQDDAGNTAELKIDPAVREATSQDHLGLTGTIGVWRQKVERGWHKLV